MGLIHNNHRTIPAPDYLINIIDAINTFHTTGSGNINDGINNIIWTRNNTVTDTVEDGVSCFNMDDGYLETGASALFGQYYTCFYLWKPRTSDSGWRTLHRNDNDHIGLVQDTTKNLGMFSNRDGGFRDSGYDISIEWQTLIITGTGDTSSSATGTTTYYVNGSNVGTSDRVASGTDLYRIGWPNQGPGKMAVMGSYSKILSAAEIQTLHNILYSRV